MLQKIKIYEEFFGKSSEEEQLKIKELAEKLNIKNNDAIWIIIYVFNYFGRFYNDLPQKLNESANDILEKIKESNQETNEIAMKNTENILTEKLEEVSRKLEYSKYSKGSRDIFTAGYSLCAGIFLLCLICFVAGAAIIGKRWGKTPIDALLMAPAGWIIPVCILPLAVFLASESYANYRYSAKKKELIPLAIAFFLVLISAAILFRMMN